MELLKNIKSCLKCNSNDLTVSYGQSTIELEFTPIKSIKCNTNSQLKRQSAQVSLKLNFNSNDIQENLVINQATEFPLLFATPEKQRKSLTSTFMHSESYTVLENDLTYISPTFSQIFHNQTIGQDDDIINDRYDAMAFSNQCYTSPDVNQFVNAFTNQFYQSPELDNVRKLNFVDLQNQPEVESNEFQSINSCFVDKSIQEQKSSVILVCCVTYRAKECIELNLQFSDRVKLLNETDEQYLVQNIVSNECGYVPKHCLVTLSQFLNDLNFLNF